MSRWLLWRTANCDGKLLTNSEPKKRRRKEVKGRLSLRPKKLAVRKAVILAAGLSTRTYPLTLRKPKPLLKLANEPNLCHLIRGLKSAGVKHVVLVVGFERQQIERRFGNDFEGIKVDYALQEQALGTGHAVLQAEPFIKGEPFMVHGA